MALDVLETLDEKRHSTLVIVLADHVEPGEYYCLMEAGAVQYFEVREDPVRILRGVEWAARVLAP
jgi:DNA-binding NarL/FixJ family response regulator